MSEADIPAHIWKESKVVEKLDDDSTEVTYPWMDMIWGSLQEKLPNLREVALAVLTIPHSNAREERVFSMIRKKKTDFRSNLDLRRSLSSIMTIKMNKPANNSEKVDYASKENPKDVRDENRPYRIPQAGMMSKFRKWHLREPKFGGGGGGVDVIPSDPPRSLHLWR